MKTPRTRWYVTLGTGVEVWADEVEVASDEGGTLHLYRRGQDVLVMYAAGEWRRVRQYTSYDGQIWEPVLPLGSGEVARP
jgi:hypothetical protein